MSEGEDRSQEIPGIVNIPSLTSGCVALHEAFVSLKNAGFTARQAMIYFVEVSRLSRD